MKFENHTRCYIIPTSTHDDEEVETFNADVEKAMEENRTHYLFIAGAATSMRS